MQQGAENEPSQGCSASREKAGNWPGYKLVQGSTMPRAMKRAASAART